MNDALASERLSKRRQINTYSDDEEDDDGVVSISTCSLNDSMNIHLWAMKTFDGTLKLQIEMFKAAREVAVDAEQLKQLAATTLIEKRLQELSGVCSAALSKISKILETAP